MAVKQLQDCCQEASKLLSRSFKTAARELQHCCQGASNLVPGRLTVVTSDAKELKRL